MNAHFRSLMLRQTDAALSTWRGAPLAPRPSCGWLRAIRNAFGISSPALAKRLGITASAVRKLEAAEAEDAITLGTLRRIAAGLGCELRYALVPGESLETLRARQAEEVARRQVRPVARSMALEDQALDPEATEAQVKAIVQALLAADGKELWN